MTDGGVLRDYLAWKYLLEDPLFRCLSISEQGEAYKTQKLSPSAESRLGAFFPNASKRQVNATVATTNELSRTEREFAVTQCKNVVEKLYEFFKKAKEVVMALSGAGSAKVCATWQNVFAAKPDQISESEYDRFIDEAMALLTSISSVGEAQVGIFAARRQISTPSAALKTLTLQGRAAVVLLQPLKYQHCGRLDPHGVCPCSKRAQSAGT